jgi:hypothetical protein
VVRELRIAGYQLADEAAVAEALAQRLEVDVAST